MPVTGPTRSGERSPAIARTAFVATYPPRRCGIATFTHDLAASTGNREIVALHPPDQTGPYPIEVHHRIRSDEAADYRSAARSVSDCVDIVSIQHEYGIWGGTDGEHVLDFVDALRVPAIATLHTVLRAPTPGQRAILSELVASVEATVVMSQSAASLLATAYDVDPRRLEIIPHGVPDLPLVDPESIKPSLDLVGRRVILSFGLLGPGKGYELAIDALPDVVAAHPEALYVIVGATHPDLVRREGEAYRNGLVARARAHGLGDHVRFVDRFVGRVELSRWLEAADVFVTPYPNLDQIVSGTLSYAMGAGRAIVSTPYAYASELLADGRGLLVPPGSPAVLARALVNVLEDGELRAAMGRRAYEHSRRMVWSSVGTDYGRLIARVAGERRAAVRIAPMAAVGA
ncbi:MAG: glycosyltransferase family 4 protein [Chloroflexi bacterium]|nr:glycosyltransferase family 4 protein [Chloroflexota bacterium]